jgi:hypothetical protein
MRTMRPSSKSITFKQKNGSRKISEKSVYSDFVE